jgi:hypothetical protein
MDWMLDELTKRGVRIYVCMYVCVYGIYMRGVQLDDKTQLLWTSTIGNVLCFRQTDGKPDLERLAVLDHGLNFRFHGTCLCIYIERDRTRAIEKSSSFL